MNPGSNNVTQNSKFLLIPFVHENSPPVLKPVPVLSEFRVDNIFLIKIIHSQ